LGEVPYFEAITLQQLNAGISSREIIIQQSTFLPLVGEDTCCSADGGITCLLVEEYAWIHVHSSIMKRTFSVPWDREGQFFQLKLEEEGLCLEADYRFRAGIFKGIDLVVIKF
jgi:hypothetical protein